MNNKKEDSSRIPKTWTAEFFSPATHNIEILINDGTNINKLVYKNSIIHIGANHIIISTDKDGYTVSDVHQLNKVKSYKILDNDN